MKYPYEDNTRSANGVAEKGEVTIMAESEGGEISTESKDGINVGMSAEESVKKTGNEEGMIVSDQKIEKDTVLQEEEREQSLETHSDIGMCTPYSSEDYHYYHCILHFIHCNSSTDKIKETEVEKACALNGEMKGFVESSKNSHTAEGWTT